MHACLEERVGCSNDDQYDLATIHDFVILVKVMSLVIALAVVKFFNIRLSSVKVPTTRPRRTRD